MPLVPFQPQPIAVRVADVTQAGTRYCQIARFAGLSHTQAADGAGGAVITVTVTLHERKTDGTPGAALSGKGITTYDESLKTDNDTLVAVETGALLLSRNPGETASAWALRASLVTEPAMLQSDYFCYLRDNHPVQIGELIRTHIAQADAMGRFS